MRYTQAYDGEWIQPKRKGYRMRCCDCALVHVVDFRVRAGKVQIRPRRDNRATARARKRRAKGKT